MDFIDSLGDLLIKYILLLINDKSFQDGSRFCLYVILAAEGLRLFTGIILYSFGMDEKRIKKISHRQGLLLNFPAACIVAYHTGGESTQGIVTTGIFYGMITLGIHWHFVKFVMPFFNKLFKGFNMSKFGSQLLVIVFKWIGFDLTKRKK